MKKEKKEQIRAKWHGRTQELFTTAFLKIGLKEKCDKIVNWAELHRKATFFITISFLSSVLILSIVMHPHVSFSDGLKAEMDKSGVKDTSMTKIKKNASNLGKGVIELVEVSSMQNDLNTLRKKKKLTSEDSIKMKELYLKSSNLMHKSK